MHLWSQSAFTEGEKSITVTRELQSAVKLTNPTLRHVCQEAAAASLCTELAQCPWCSLPHTRVKPQVPASALASSTGTKPEVPAFQQPKGAARRFITDDISVYKNMHSRWEDKLTSFFLYYFIFKYKNFTIGWGDGPGGVA